MEKNIFLFLKKQLAKTDWPNVLLFSCISFLASVFIFTFLNWAEAKNIFLVVFFLVTIACFLLFNKKDFALLFFVFVVFGFGVWAIEIEKNQIAKPVEQKWATGSFLVTELPEKKADYWKVVGCFQADDKSSETFNCREKTLIFGASADIFEFGDLFQVKCQINPPENKYEKFNYIRYLAKDDIYQICSRPSFSSKKNILLDLDNPNFQFRKSVLWRLKFLEFVYQIRERVEWQIKEYFQEPGASYLAGLLLGGDDRLPEKVSEDFRKTGTTHTVAVSGYNITILASFLMWFGIAIGFWRQKAFWLAVVGIIFFIFMIGAPSSAVRAAIMGILILWAVKNGKLANSWRAIILAAFLMIVFSPFMLVYDVGFQLSFLATLSLVFLYTPLSEKFEITNDFLELKSILLMTIVAQMGVLGLIVYNFESFSLLSLLANLIILPLVPTIMLGGFVVIIFGFFMPFLAGFLAMPVQSLLDFEIWIVSVLAEFKWAMVEFNNLSIWWLIGYYLFFIGLILKYNHSTKIEKRDETKED